MAGIIIAICYYVVLIVQLWIMSKEKNPAENEIFSVTIPNEVMENEEIQKVRKKYGKSIGLAGVVSAVLPAVILFTDWTTVQILIWMILFILIPVLEYVPYWRANRALKILKEQNHYMERAPHLTEIDDMWKWGIFYYNPKDEHLTTEKKIGVGTCVNHAKKRGKVLTVAAWAAIAALLVLGIFLIRVQSAPLTLTYEDGVLKSGQTRTNYTLEADVMQMAMLLDKMPKESKIIGTGLDNLQRGIYNVDGFGNCKINLNPQNHAFILIYAEDGCYIFSADTDEKTKEVFDQLKEDL